MKGIYIVIAILIALGLWFFLGGSSEEVVVEEAGTEEVVEGEEASVTEGDEAIGEDSSNEVVFDLTGEPFAFSETELRVKEGDTVTINFTTVGGFHDWVVDEFSAATDRVGEGATASVTFVASAAGEYEYYCSVGNHRAQGMIGKLIVE